MWQQRPPPSDPRGPPWLAASGRTAPLARDHARRAGSPPHPALTGAEWRPRSWIGVCWDDWNTMLSENNAWERSGSAYSNCEVFALLQESIPICIGAGLHDHRHATRGLSIFSLAKWPSRPFRNATSYSNTPRPWLFKLRASLSHVAISEQIICMLALHSHQYRSQSPDQSPSPHGLGLSVDAWITRKRGRDVAYV